MIKREFPRVQHLSWIISGPPPSRVNAVPQNGMAEMLKVHTNLVRPSAVKATLDQARSLSAAENTKIRPRLAPAFPRHCHSCPVNTMPSDGKINRSCILPQSSSDEREINFFDCARGELFGESEMSGIIFGDNQAAARLFVETMDNAGP